MYDYINRKSLVSSASVQYIRGICDDALSTLMFYLLTYLLTEWFGTRSRYIVGRHCGNSGQCWKCHC